MSPVDILLIVGAFALILWGAESFTDGVEWLGRMLKMSEGATGSILAAIGTATPETLIPVVAILFTNSVDAEAARGLRGPARARGALRAAPRRYVPLRRGGCRGPVVAADVAGAAAFAAVFRYDRARRALLSRLRRRLLARDGLQHAPRRA